MMPCDIPLSDELVSFVAVAGALLGACLIGYMLIKKTGDW